MRVLISGASGFIGSHLVDALKSRHEVHALDVRLPERSRGAGVAWVSQDLGQPLERAKLPPTIDAVVHLAQSPHYRQFPDKADDIFAVNVHGTLQLLEYARTAGARGFVLASSGGIYGRSSHRVVETDLWDPLDFYQSSKCCAELLAAQYSAFFSVTTLRPFFVYGRSQTGMLIPTLLEKVQSREAITIRGNPGLRLNPIHVSDAVRVIERSLVHAPQGAFNVCGDETVSMTELVAVMEKATGIAAQIEYAASTSTGDLVADNGKMKAMLGISPSIRLLEGIRGML